MPPPQCFKCKSKPATIKRPKTSEKLCKECFYFVFEEEIHETIIKSHMFNAGDNVAIGASGGKDSTVLMHVLKVLNERHNYGVNLILLSIDEGIKGYRDPSLETVKRNSEQYNLPLTILSYKDLYGYTMDEIVELTGGRNSCTFCGVFRRQCLDRGGIKLKANCIVTGHNADDIAETVLMNLLRGDISRLGRCVNEISGGNEGEMSESIDSENDDIKRCKPMKYSYEKEIVLYAYYKHLDYFSTECTYAPEAYRGYAREYLKDLERINSRVIIDIINSCEEIKVKSTTKVSIKKKCKKCGYISSQELCQACSLLNGIEKGMPLIPLGRRGRKAEREANIKLEDDDKEK